MRRSPYAIATILTLLVVGPTASAASRDGVYSGRTADGRAVRFLVFGGGTRVGDFTFGALQTRCDFVPGGGYFDAFAAQSIRVRRGRFSGFYEIPSGSEFVSASGRLLSRRRARGSVGTTSRTDCSNTRVSWTATRQPTLGPRRRLHAGPVLAGTGVAWAEGPGSPRSAPRRPALRPAPGRRWTVRLGGGQLGGVWPPAHTLISLPIGALPFAGLSGSSNAVALAAGGRVYAGDMLGTRPRRLPGTALPAADGNSVLYASPQAGPTPGEVRVRDVRDPSGSSDRIVARHTLDRIDGLRLAGSWAAVRAGRVFVVPRGSAVPPILDEGAMPTGVPYVVDIPATGGFDLASDGKLVVTRPVTRPGCPRCFAIEWHSPTQPAAHPLVGPPAARSDVAIARDRIAYVARDTGLTAIRVTTLGDRERTVAVFSRSRTIRHELIGNLDFDGDRLTFASRSSRRIRGRWRVGRVRIELVQLSRSEP